MNVGGAPGNDKPSSPVMFVESVGGIIVLGARESRVHVCLMTDKGKDARKSTAL